MTRQSFLAEVDRIMNTHGHYIQCPDCEGTKGHERYCDCMGIGCHWCNGEGIIFTTCNTCNGEGEVWVTVDEDLELFRRTA